MKSISFFLLLALLSTASLVMAQEKKAGQIVTNYFNWIDAGNIEAVGSLLTEDFKATASFAPIAFDKKSWRGVGENFKTAYPGMKHEIVDWFADDNKVVVSGIFKGTNTGPNMGNPPTGNKVVLPFTTIFHLNGKGKIKMLDSKFDMKSFEGQLMAGIDPKASARKLATDYFAAVDAANVDFAMNFTDDFVFAPPIAPVPLDKNGWVSTIQSFKTACPDGNHAILDWFTDGNKICVKGVYTGTNTGPLMGNPPTGNKLTIPFNAIIETDGMGKIKAVLPMFDIKNFEAQLMAGINPNAANEAAVRGIMAAADAGDGDKLLSYFAPGAMHYFGGVGNTNDELKKRVAGFKAGFPDIKRSIEIISNANNVVTAKGWLIGTNTGMFMGKPATGSKIKVSALAVYKFDDTGKVIEAWVELDSSTLMSQLKGETAVGDASAKKH